MDISARMRAQDMTPFQVMAVGICLLINTIDGFDVLAIAFLAPEIARQWSLPPTQVGMLFSIGLFGMVLGALFISPLADRYGRRPVILMCLVMISVGMLASSITQNLSQLATMRLFTGIGVSGMLASINTMTAEYSSDRRRKLAISFLQSGYTVGGIIAGLISTYVIVNFGWRAVFIFGGTLSAVMIPIVYFLLPESLDYLLSKPKANTLPKVNRVLARLGHAQVTELPALPVSKEKSRSTIAELFSPQFLAATIGIWLSFFMLMCGWYFAVNWTPKILVDAGLSLSQGISGGVLMSLGGVVGGILLGFLSARFSAHWLVAIFLLLGAATMALFGQLETNLNLMLALTFAIGFFLAGTMIGLYTLVPDIYPARMRSTGTGWAVGIGRLGAVIGPYIGGLLIAAGWGRPMYFAALGMPLLIAMLAVLWLKAGAEN